jgi:A/G-specific adenine glycosylase
MSEKEFRPDPARQEALLAWYRQHRRRLPWRHTRDPYRILVSEIMLQQTRAEVVIPYYQRFLRRFPTLQGLARAQLGEVIRQWSGLGYYRRAENLHRAARLIVSRYGGRIPASFELLRALPGIGDYTARAVLSIAFSEPLAVVDANVARVLVRWHALRGSPRQSRLQKKLRQLADAWLDTSAPGEWNQAMMELGATLCRPRQPLCEHCPVRQGCQAYERGLVHRLPKPAARPRICQLTLSVLIPVDGRQRTLLVRQTPVSRLFADLWHFPAARGSRLQRPDGLGLDPQQVIALEPVRHSVTTRELQLQPWLCLVKQLPAPGPTARTIPLGRVAGYEVSSATRKLARQALARLASIPAAAAGSRARLLY